MICILFILPDCDHVGPIYTLQYQDRDGGNTSVSLAIMGLGSALQHFALRGDQVITADSLRHNCERNYELLIRATDDGGKHTALIALTTCSYRAQ